jgi:CubicO group peptidase (beta-lactamase class C family)
MVMSGIHGSRIRRASKAGCLAVAVGFVVWGAAVPQKAASDSYEAARANADRQAKEWIARGTPGLSLAVAVDGKIVYSEGFCFADLEERVPVWPTTKFRIGSVSKPLTAIALVQLVEAGKLDLDAPVQKYVPSFPDKGAVITTRMLATPGRHPALPGR